MAFKITNIFLLLFYPNLDFCFENMPSGNPGTEQENKSTTQKIGETI
jgi:hypothetical protein